MVHAAGLLSLESDHQRRCTILDLFTEIDRLLRPEVPILNNSHHISSTTVILPVLIFRNSFGEAEELVRHVTCTIVSGC